MVNFLLVPIISYTNLLLALSVQGTQLGRQMRARDGAVKNRADLYRELIMPPGVMSLVSNFGWLANHERGQRSK